MAEIDAARTRAETWLRARQNADGSWVGEVDLNPGPTAQVVMLHAVLRRDFPERLVPKARAYLLRTQNDDGGWSPHLGEGSEVSLTCECYVGLRLLGEEESAEPVARARARIEALGGPAKANPWTQLYLAMLGVLPWERIYRTPVEIMLAPRWLPVQLADLSYWVKTITVPMALLGALGPGKPIELAPTLARELRVEEADFSHPLSHPFLLPARGAGRALAGALPGLRAKAIRRAWEMIATFTEAHGDFGGNTCTAMNVLMAMDCAGRRDDPAFEAGYRALMSYGIEDDREWHVQCCQSHVWDTGFALCALPVTPEGPETNSAVRGLDWLRERQILDTYGDWRRNAATVKPGGWCFGNRHDHFPVTDCSALGLLASARHDPAFARSERGRRAIDWLLAMQHEEGGWSAYDRYRRGQWLNRVVKFKDIDNALVDVPKADVTAKVLEALAYVRDADPRIEDALARGRAFLLATREDRGLWKGNYGVNYLYGTAFSAKALRAIDREPRADWADASREFFLRTQNGDGGWGEVEASYRDPSRAGTGPSAPVQTAWALLGLAAAGDAVADARMRAALERGLAYLARTQRADGVWVDPLPTGTVFPGMVYFRYELYRAYFPLMALRDAGAALGRSDTKRASL